jgi:hypothetical protein
MSSALQSKLVRAAALWGRCMTVLQVRRIRPTPVRRRKQKILKSRKECHISMSCMAGNLRSPDPLATVRRRRTGLVMVSLAGIFYPVRYTIV